MWRYVYHNYAILSSDNVVVHYRNMIKRVGRPPFKRSQVMRKFFTVRMRPEDIRAVLSAVERSGKSQSDWIRETLLQAAQRV